MSSLFSLLFKNVDRGFLGVSTEKALKMFGQLQLQNSKRHFLNQE